MLAKGLDLPLVTLVGIILAETGLNLPDYRAAERSFQVLTQVSGRAGRSPLGGRVVMQTYQPENYVIQAASRHDFAGFYAQELANRRELGYPPFTRLVRLEYRSPSEEKCRQEAELMAEILRTEIRGLGWRRPISSVRCPAIPASCSALPLANHPARTRPDHDAERAAVDGLDSRVDPPNLL
jgi:primosomal protein N' (replication factor Y)